MRGGRECARYIAASLHSSEWWQVIVLIRLEMVAWRRHAHPYFHPAMSTPNRLPNVSPTRPTPFIRTDNICATDRVYYCVPLQNHIVDCSDRCGRHPRSSPQPYRHRSDVAHVVWRHTPVIMQLQLRFSSQPTRAVKCDRFVWTAANDFRCCWEMTFDPFATNEMFRWATISQLPRTG